MAKIKIYEANNFKEFSYLINKFKLKAHFSILRTNDEAEFLGTKFGHKSSDNQKYDWLNQHFTVSYSGNLLDVKVPTPVGRGIYYFRPRLEKKYNDGFIKIQSLKKYYEHEAITQHVLSQRNLNAFKVPIQLNERIKNAIISVKEKNISHLLDRIESEKETCSFDEIEVLIGKTFSKLSEIHQFGTVWGDPWLGNFYIDSKDELITSGFGFEFNKENMSLENGFVKDFMHLFYSAAFRNNLPVHKVSELAIKNYEPTGKVKENLITECQKEPSKRANKKFLKPVFGLDKDEISFSKETLLEYL